MAGDGFRPDRTTGILAVGRFGELDRFELLADGARLTDPGALTPGVTVADFDLFPS
jgi:hypothetical protein